MNLFGIWLVSTADELGDLRGVGFPELLPGERRAAIAACNNVAGNAGFLAMASRAAGIDNHACHFTLDAQDMGPA